MSSQGDPLNQTACCGPGQAAPDGVRNRPGLSALSYRVGTHATFLERMLSRLSTQEIAGGPHQGARPLAALATRERSDPAIALLDAFAAVADVLTFYQERIATEGYLRTATERLSVLELARATGYELSPGVAASVRLAFTVEETDSTVQVVQVPESTRVQSVPGQNQLPQTFETVEPVEARAAWNRLSPRTSKPQPLYQGMTRLFLKGINTQLQPGDAILIVGDERVDRDTSVRWDFRILDEVLADAEAGLTMVQWRKELGGTFHLASEQNPVVYAFRATASFFGYNAPDWHSLPKQYRDDYAKAVGESGSPTEWPGFSIGTGDEIDLDAAYPKVLPGSWVAIAPNATTVQAFQVVEASTGARSGFGLSSRTTRLKLDEPLKSFPWTRQLDRRRTQLYLQTDRLEVAELPLVVVEQGVRYLTEPVHGNSITLDRVVEGLPAGRRLLVTGRRVRLRVVSEHLSLVPDSGGAAITPARGEELLALAAPVESGGLRTWRVQDHNGATGTVTAKGTALLVLPAAPAGETVAEEAVLSGATAAGGRTVLTLKAPLAYWYDPATVTIHANVALATHGERVEESLGSGDASRAYQRFTLKKRPLTYVSSASASGARSTLSVRVNGVKWEERASLLDAGPDSTEYIVRTDAEGNAVLIFGDGRHGARLSSGRANVAAAYRSGIGPEGNVGAGRLTLLQTRPAGIRAVTNPLPATGGAGPETLEGARANAPLRVMTLDRIVSRQDYEDFARSFAGIGQALAEEVWAGERQMVHITVAGAQGESIAAGTAVHQNLLDALRRYGDPTRRVLVSGYEKCLFRVGATLILDTPRYEPDVVLSAVQRKLTDAFGFPGRRFAQPVVAAAVLAVIQAVPGVTAVESLSVRPAGGVAAGQQPAVLEARGARWDGTAVQPAQMLLIDPDGITLTRR